MTTDQTGRVQLAEGRFGEQLSLAARPAREIADIDPYTADIEPWLHIGDPLAEAAWETLRSSGQRDRNVVRGLRVLADGGDAACQAFLADVGTVPSWADFDQMRSGAAWAARNPLGILLGLLSALPVSYASANTAAVLVRAGNLLRAVPRRVWETSGLFIAALDVDSMRPGGPGWESLVRIRMMHTMVRTGILRTGTWDAAGPVPIAAAETANGSFLFGTLRARVIAEVGPPLDDSEVASFCLMWRYITRLMGGPPELSCATQEAQDILDRRLVYRLYSPNADSAVLTGALLEGLPHLGAGPRLPGPVADALARRLLRPGLVRGVDLDVAEDLGVAGRPALELAVRAGMGVSRLLTRAQHIGLVRRYGERAGRAWLNGVVQAGLEGRPADYQA